MNARAVATMISAGRVGLGALLIAAPELGTGMWLGKDGRRAGGRVLARGLGARDVGIGLGVLSALSSGGGPLRAWLAAGVLADAGDLVGTLVERDGLPGSAVPLIAPLAGAGVVLGLVALAGAGDGSAPVPA